MVSYTDPRGTAIQTNMSFLVESQPNVQFPTIDDIENVSGLVFGGLSVSTTTTTNIIIKTPF